MIKQGLIDQLCVNFNNTNFGYIVVYDTFGSAGQWLLIDLKPIIT